MLLHGGLFLAFVAQFVVSGLNSCSKFRFLLKKRAQERLLREPLARAIARRSGLGQYFLFLSVFLRQSFDYKITFVTKLAHEMNPESTPNLTLD